MISETKPRGAMATHPDGFTGLLLALEGIADAAVILHGPTGCRAYHGALAERLFPREIACEPLNHVERFYFGQPRIPTTYLDGDDFVFGGQAKLDEAVHAVLARRPGLLAVVNSPGAALIGDDLRQSLRQVEAALPCVALEFPAVSHPLADGYQQGMLAVLDALGLSPQPARAKTVSLLGLSIGHQHWSGSLAELRALLRLCGIEVCCAIGAGSAIADWRQLPHAACHVIIHEEYGDRIAAWLRNRFAAPVLNSEAGAPLGFDATETWVRAVAESVGADPSPALAHMREQRRHAARALAYATKMQGAVKGTTFGLRADPSLALPLAQWLYTYLGMLPLAVETPEYADTPLALRLRAWLETIGCGTAWQADTLEADPELLFADGQHNTLARIAGYAGAMVDIIWPSGSYTDVLPKALLGAQGSLWLTEQIVNALNGQYLTSVNSQHG